MKRIVSVLLAILLIFVTVVSASAADFGCDIEPVSDAVFMVELTTGTVVVEHNSAEKVYPASTTKIMTYIIVVENVSDINTEMVPVKEEALADLDPESSVMGLASHIGESFSVKDLLYGLMLPSGNDAALVLADYVGNGVDGFVEMMNRKAAQLGCENTHFTSPHGLHDSQHYTTAEELAIITKYAMETEGFMDICNTVTYQPDGFGESIKTTNYLLDSSAYEGRYYYQYAKGIKTGYTDQAGRCLVSTAEKDGFRYLCVALGADYSYAEDINYAMLDTVDYYDWAFNNLSMKTVYDSADTLQSVPVEYVWGNKMLYLVPAAPVQALLPDDYDASQITTRVECRDTATAPVQKGDVFGKLTVYYGDTIIGRTEIVASETIERSFTNYLLKRIASAIQNHWVLFIIILLVLLVLIVFIISRIRRNRARRARRAKRAR